MENIIKAPLKTREINDAKINTDLETLKSDCKMYRAQNSMMNMILNMH